MWRCLRRPFTLPENTQRLHTCEWETIDMGLLGCRVCGCVHICHSLTCKDVIETNEGRVCALSGVVVYDKAYSDLEYLDTLALSDSIPVTNDFDGEMSNMVRNILSSRQSQNLRRKLLGARLLHLNNNMHSSLNVLECCMKFLAGIDQAPYLFEFVSSKRREQIVLQAIEDCGRGMYVMISNGMSIKPVEVQRITVGLLYMMRCGVTLGATVIMPQRTDIRSLLPPENTLLKTYGIHPKFITETENRLKFSIRSVMNKVS